MSARVHIAADQYSRWIEGYRAQGGWTVFSESVPATATGIQVSEQRSLGITAVWCAVNFLSSIISTLPLHVYRRLTEREVVTAYSHPVYRLLARQPNPNMTAATWRRTAMSHMLLWGNSYSQILRDSFGRPSEIWPLRPDRVTPKMNGSRIWYEYQMDDGQRVPFAAEEVLHLPGLSFDGLMGYSPIKVHRESLGLTMAAEQFGARLFGNSARPSGVLEHPGKLGEKARDHLRDSWQAMYQGVSNAHKTAILEEGMKFNALSINPEDAQFLQTRTLQLSEVGRIFNLSPVFLHDLSRATFSNIEHLSIDLQRFTLAPLVVPWEQEIDRKLLPGGPHYSKHSFEGLLRGDTAARYTAYGQAIKDGWLNRNEVRALEDLNPTEGLDEYLVPLNMAGANEPPPEPNTPVPPAPDGNPNALQILRPMLEATMVSIVNAEADKIVRASRNPDFGQWLEDFYGDKHQKAMAEKLAPFVASLGAATDPDTAKNFVMAAIADHIEASKDALQTALARGADLAELANSWRSARAQLEIEAWVHEKI